MLAIAAPSFNIPSETFIRDHVCHIAPGETILLCESGQDTEQYGCPVLADLNAYKNWVTLRERVSNSIRFCYQRYFDPGLCAQDRQRVKIFLEKYRPRALLAEYGPVGCLLMRSCMESGIPLYVHFHGYDATLLAQAPRQVGHYRKLFRVSAAIIAPSRFLAKKLADLGCPEDKLAISPCGVDPARFRPTSGHTSQIIACVGRLVEKKAPHLTIEAFSQISARFPRATLEIVGDGPFAELCRQTIHRFGVHTRVIMHGVKDPVFVSALMQKASLYAQHSVQAKDGDTESFGVSLVEAMACELPVVTTRHNGFVDTVEHGSTGFLVEEHDVESMAAAMAMLLEDPKLAAQVGAAGRKRVLENFTHQHTRQRLRATMGLPTAPPMQAQLV